MRPEHAKAARGIKTAEIQPPKSGLGNPTTMKHKLADHIQTDMHRLDKLLRRASVANDKERVNQLLNEAEPIYNRLALKIIDHENKYGSLPHWVSYTYHGRTENWRGKDGRVKRTMAELKSANPKEMKQYQRKLFNAVKLDTEASR